MSGIFMRGNPLNMGKQYFIVGKSNETYYYMMADPSKVGGIVMYSTNYFNISPSRVTVNRSSSNRYSLRTINGDGISMYLSLSDGVIDAMSTGTTSISLTDEWNLSQNVLYPGIFYSLEGKLNAYTCTSTTTIPLCNASSNTKELKDMTIMLIPINETVVADNNTGYGTLSVFSNGDCVGSLGETLGLQLFESWIGVNTVLTQSNCNVIGPLTTSSNNCVFSSVDACTARYLYQYTSGDCGDNIGICTEGCRYSNSSPPFTCESSETQEDKDETKTNLFLALFLLVFIIIGMLLVFGYFGKNNNEKLEVKTYP